MVTATRWLTTRTVRREMLPATRAIGVIFAAAGLLMGTWASRLPGLRESADLTSGELGLVLLAMSVGSISATIGSAGLVRRFGERAVIRFGCAVAVAGLCALAADAGAGGLVLGLLLIGLGGGAWDVAMNVAGGTLERWHRRTVMYRFHAAFSVGTVLGALVGSAFARLSADVTPHLLCVAGLLLFCMLVGTHAESIDGVPAGRAPSWPQLPAAGSGHWWGWRTVALGLIVAGAAFAEGSASDWLAIAGVDGYGLDEHSAALGLAVFVLAMTLTRYVLGAMPRGRLPGRRILLAGSLLVALGSGLVCLGGLRLLQGGDSGLWIGTIGAICWGIGVAPAFPLAMRAAARTAHGPAACVSSVSAIGYSAFLAGPPTMGAVADRFGILSAVLLAPVVLATAVLLAGAARQRGPASPSPPSFPAGDAQSSI